MKKWMIILCALSLTTQHILAEQPSKESIENLLIVTKANLEFDAKFAKMEKQINEKAAVNKDGNPESQKMVNDANVEVLNMIHSEFN